MMSAEKVPLIITVLLGAIGWLTAHIVDRIEGSPVIKYSIEYETGKGGPAVSLSLKNITHNVVFKNITIVLVAPEGGTFTDAAIFPTEPAFEGDGPWKLSGRTAQFTIPFMQPDWQFRVYASYSGDGRPTLRLDVSDSTVRATRPSLDTLLVEHENEIFYWLLATWSVVSAFFFRERPVGGRIYRWGRD
jgi:hypothetical protein